MKGKRISMNADNEKQAARYIGRNCVKFFREKVGEEVDVNWLLQNMPNSVLLSNIRRWIEENIITESTIIKIGKVRNIKSTNK